MVTPSDYQGENINQYYGEITVWAYSAGLAEVCTPRVLSR